MSARERSRYMTVTIVFLAAFVVLGGLMARTAMVMAQGFTFRPQAAVSNTYSGIPSTQNLGLAFDSNILTAATTYTNADFSGDGATPDDDFSFSGRWAAFQQTTTFIKDVGLYVIREGIDNSAVDQWTIEYSITGISGTWITLDDPTISGDNPAKSEVSTFSFPDAIPDDTDLRNALAVRTTSRQRGINDAKLEIFDIRIEAFWNDINGGPHPLRIDSPDVLEDGLRGSAYTPVTFVASGGNLPYDWCIASGSLPAGMSFTPVLPDCPSSAQSPTIDLSGTPTEGGTFDFTVRVTDNSSTTQQAESDYSLYIAGLGIAPPGPRLDDWGPIVVGSSGSQTFTPSGGTSPYKWCLVSGSIPPGTSWATALPTCPSVVTAASIYVSGTPTEPGVYSFTIRLSDSGGETPAEHHYVAEVSSSNVTVLKRLLKPVVKEIQYGVGAADMAPHYLRAINVRQAATASEVYWSTSGSPGLPSGFSLMGTTLSLVSEIGPVYTSSAYIGGTIGITENSGTFAFTATVDDKGIYQDSESFELEVLERQTLLRRTPPSAVALPDDPTASNYHTLDFVVFAKGGAPSIEPGAFPGCVDSLDGREVPYYTYSWEVTPVGDAPALENPTGTAPATECAKPGPVLISILFEEDETQEIPVTGTYIITFQAEDYLRRTNSSDPDYKFVPATARIKIMSPAGRTLEKDPARPTLMRQEQFR